MRFCLLLLSSLLALMLAGCIDVTIPDTGEEDTGGGGSTGTPIVNPDGPGFEGAPDTRGGGLVGLDTGSTGADSGVELPASCATHCDCPPDFDCINEICVVGPMAIQCCSHPKCPAGDRCWSSSGIESVCGGAN